MEKFFLLKNVSSGPVSLGTTVLSNLINTPSDLASALTVEIVPVNADGEAIEAPVSSTLLSISQSQLPISGLIEPNTAQRYRLRYTLASTYEAQAQVGGFDLVFTGQQRL